MSLKENDKFYDDVWESIFDPKTHLRKAFDEYDFIRKQRVPNSTAILDSLPSQEELEQVEHQLFEDELEDMNYVEAEYERSAEQAGDEALDLLGR